MSDERIDSYIDREGVKRDTAYMLESLNAVYDGFKRVESVKLDLKGMTGLSGIAPGMQQAKTAADELEKATKAVQDRIAQLNGQSKEFTQVLLTQAKAQKEAAQASLLEAKADTERAKAKQSSVKAGQDATRQALLEKKAAQDAANEYKQLSLAYNEAALRAKNYALTLGSSHSLTVQAATDAALLGAKLKAADASVGQFQRNVGDYGNAITKAAGDAFGYIRKIAYILPGIGIAGIFSAIFEGISSAASALFSFGSNAEKAKEKFADFLTTASDIRANAASGTEAELAKVQVLTGIVSDQTQSYKERNNALSQLKEINKNYFGDLDLETLKIGTLKTRVEEYSDAIIAAAVVKGFSDEIGKLAVELSKQERAYNDAGHAVDFYKKSVIDARSKAGDPKGMAAINFDVTDAENNLLGATNKFKEQSAVVNVLRGQMFDLRKAIKDAVEEQIKFKPLGASGSDGKDDGIAERRRKANFDALILEQQQVAATNKAIFEDENRTHADRLIALQAYVDAKSQILTLEEDFEKGKKGVLKEEIVRIEKEKQGKVLELNRETEKELEKINAQFTAAIQKEASVQEQVYDKFYKDLTERYKKYLKEKDKLDKEATKKEEDQAALKKKLIEELETASISLAKTILEANIERQKNETQDKINALETQKQKDIEVANQTIANAQERAAAITVIEARAAAQKEQLQQKQRQLDVKKAEFEKAAAIATIIQQTAGNLVKAFPNPGLIALASALGAVQLATVIAQPIPRYYKGKNENDRYEGPAIVGDGGKRELILREDGTVQITDDKPQLAYLKSRDIVLPDTSKLLGLQLARSSAYMAGSGSASQDMPVMVAEVRKMTDRVVGAIGKIPQPQIKVENMLTRRIKRGDSSNTYLNSNLQG